jgi:hypothetical protein
VLGLLVTLGDVLGGLAGLLDSLSGSLGGHVEISDEQIQLITPAPFSPLFITRTRIPRFWRWRLFVQQ